MIEHNFWRSRYLAAASIGIGLTAIYSVIVPTAGNRSVSAFDFPDRIALPSWQLIDSQSLSSPQDLPDSQASYEKGEKIKSGKSYHYIKGDRQLDISMQYIVGTRGDVYIYLHQYTDISPKIVSRQNRQENLKYKQNIGSYLLFSDRDRVYLSSCINPNGEDNVTQRQFSQNLNDIDWQSGIWLNWLLGKSIIRDRRCLWTQLSMPIDRLEVSTAYEILERNWVDWSKWWKPRFPQF